MNKGMCGGLGKGVTWEIFNFEVIKVKVRVCVNWNFLDNYLEMELESSGFDSTLEAECSILEEEFFGQRG